MHLPIATPPKVIEVLLSYEELPNPSFLGKRAMFLRHKKKNKGPKKKAGAKQTGTKKKRGKKKKPVFIPGFEVTSATSDVLENIDDLDESYQILKEKVLAVLEEEERTKFVTKATRTARLEEKVNAITAEDCDTFYLIDLTTVILKYKQFKEIMPRVQPFYALKCNPDPFIISTLVAMGAGIDAASMDEIQKALKTGQKPENIIFANPCKMPEHLKFASSVHVKKMTFDNANELRKIKKLVPEAELVLRILGDDSHSTIRFGSKFGANVSTEVKPLLELSIELGLQVIGVSFHVGSGCQSGQAYRNSLMLAREVFDLAADLGITMTFLDIGGGFLGTDTESVKLAEIGSDISSCLDELFPVGVKVIAEPGRYFASECVVLVTTVIAKRERQHETEDGIETFIDYYISDGVYGSFNNMMFDYYKPEPIPKKQLPTKADPQPKAMEIDSSKHSTLFGPTCDSIDVVCKDIQLPDLEIGDQVYFFNMGAYTSAAASSFNGFTPPTAFYIIS